jgi:DNA invertase Pin-like site-specific DNA recombinase
VSRTKKPASNPKSAVAYLRVSTADQRNGIEAQREAIERWASTQCVEIVAWFCDQGVSGAAPLDDRPGLLDALNALRAQCAGVLLTAKRDRLARDVSTAAAIERLVKEAGASIVTADGLDSNDTPEGQLVRTIIDAMAAYERALIRARTKAALRAKKSKGEVVGSVPFGFAADDRGQLVPCGNEQAALKRMRELAASGRSQPEICRALTAEGHKPRGAKWNITTVSRALRRAA